MDYEGLFGLDPATADALRAKYGGGGDAVGGGVAAVPQGGAFDINAALVDQFGPAPSPAAPKVDSFTGQPAWDGTSKILAAAPAAAYVPPAAKPAPSEQPTASAAPAPAPQAPQPMGGGGPVTIPGHWSDDKSEQSVTRTGDPAALEAIAAKNDSAQGYGQSAADSAYQAQALGIGLDQRQAEMQQQEARTYDAMLQRNAVEKKQYVDQSRARLQEMSDALAKDPTKEFWAKKSDGDKALSFFSLLLGGLGAGLTGGPNLAVQKIENEINRGVAAQEKAYGRQQNIYQEMLAEYGDRATAIQAMKVASYDKVAQQLAPLRASAKSMDAKARYEQGMASLMEKRAKEDAELQKLLGAKYEEKSSKKYKDAQVIGGAGPGKPLSNLVTLSDGTTYQLQNESQGNKVVERLQASSQLVQKWQDAAKLRAEVERLPAGSVERKKAHDDLVKLTEQVINLESVAEGQAQVKETEMPRKLANSPIMQGLRSRGVAGAIVDAVDPWREGEYKAGGQRIQAELDRVKRGEEALVRAARGRVVDETAGIDPRTGEVAFQGRYTGQVATPTAPLPPSGFKPLDSRVSQPTMGPSGREKLPYSPARRK
jgi:hypothetical protein